MRTSGVRPPIPQTIIIGVCRSEVRYVSVGYNQGGHRTVVFSEGSRGGSISLPSQLLEATCSIQLMVPSSVLKAGCVSVSSCFSCPWCPDTVGLSFQVTSPPWFLVFPALWGSLSMPCRDVPSAMLLIAHPPPGEPPISCFLGVGGSQSHWLQLLRIKTTQN